MSDFEVCPVGTLQRLAAVEAERDSMKEILDHIPQVEAELAETSDKLHAVEAERDAVRETERKFGVMMHKVMDERDALRAALDKYRGQLDRFGVHSAADAIDAAMKGGGNG